MSDIPPIHKLRLFVSGNTLPSQRAIANLEDIFDRELGARYELEVVDVLENPALAEEDKILATPTLMRKHPPPARKIIGDMSDREKVLIALDIAGARPGGERKNESGSGR